MKKKIMLIYPPGKLYQRGEERSQGNISNSTSTAARACNDLGYAAAVLKGKYEIFLKDYQNENLKTENLINDFGNFNPDFVFISITQATINDDLRIVEKLKNVKKEIVIILKGALFFDPDLKFLNNFNLENIDILVGGENDFIIDKLLNTYLENKNSLKEVKGILFKRNKVWIKTDFSKWDNKLEKLIFPDRSLINNKLYKRPDTDEPIATITTSRGCSYDCIFCLTPRISGKKVRFRTPDNIITEIKECYYKYDIKNFFFKSDTFTVNSKWVEELCESLISIGLSNKVSWVANSRVKPLKYKTLELMKKAGCWMIAYGFESGSNETLEKIKKGTKVEDNLIAASFARKAGLKIFGFFLIGLPWESKKHINKTKNLIKKIQPDFIEIHIANPYYGTELYNVVKKNKLLENNFLGKDYFNPPIIGTKYISKKSLNKYRNEILLNYHLQPKYLFNRFKESFKNRKIIENYLKYGIKLLRNIN